MASIDLNKLGPNDYYDATLSGNFVSAKAHSKVLSGTPSLQGDTLTATGRNSTLFGGAGKDSLVALGSNNYLTSGTGASTLVGTTLRGASTTLQGNGRSSLIGAAGNEVFIVSEGDRIGGVAGGTDSIRTGINNFSLADTTRRGSGVANVQNLIYTGLGTSTLTGNTRNGSLIGSATSANSLIAGTGSQTLIGGTGNDTLRGNGKSLLVGSSGNDSYLIRQFGSGAITTFDKVLESTNAGTDTARTTISNFNLADTLRYGSGIAYVERLVFEGSGNATLMGNALDNYIKGGLGNNFLGGFGGRDTLDASASSGSNTLVGSTNAGSTLIGGSGKNTFYSYNANDSIAVVGNSTNTIVSNSSKVDLSTQSGSLQFDSIGYTGIGNVTLIGNSKGGTTLNAGNAFAATLGDGGSTTADRLTGSAKGSNLFTVSSINAHTVSGGIGRDTLQVNRAQTNSNDQFSKITGVEVLSLAGSGNKVTLGGNASTQSGIDTVILSAGSNTINAASYNSGANITINASANTEANMLTGGAGDDRFIIKGGNLGLNGSVLKGNGGTDTLQIQNASTLAGFGSNVTGIEVLSLAGGGNSISAIGGSGVTLIAGGSGGDTIDASAASTSLSINASASRLGNLFTASAVNGVATSISGGSGVDTLSISDGTFGDTLFSDDTSIEVLRISGSTATRVSLGGAAYTAGIATVIGGSGAATIDASKFNNNAPPTKNLVIDTTANTTAGASYTGSVGNDLIRISNSIVFNASTVRGGTGIDTLQLTNAAIISAINSTKISSIEVLSLSGGNNSISGIGGAGIQTIIGGSGRDSIDASNSNQDIYVTGAASTLGVSLVGANGKNSTLIGSKTAGNTFVVGSQAALQLASLVGATTVGVTGRDTLQYADTVLAAGDFAKSASGSLDLLSLTGSGGGGNFVLGNDARLAGITTMIGGAAGGDTLDASAYKLGSVYLDASRARVADTLIAGSGTTSSTLIGSTLAANAFYLSNAGKLASSSLVGNKTQTDTLTFTTGGQTVLDNQIAGDKITSIEVISLTGGGNRVALGQNAYSAGINKVIGSDSERATIGDFLSAADINQGTVTLDGSGSSFGDTLVAGRGSSKTVLLGTTLASATNYFQIGTASLMGNVSIVSGTASKNVLQLTDGRQILNDNAFIGLGSADLDTLELGSGYSSSNSNEGYNTLTLGPKAQTAFRGDVINITDTTLNSGRNVINASGLSGNSTLNVDLRGYLTSSRSGYGDTITAGQGFNNLVGNSSEDANNLFIFNAKDVGLQLSNATIVGGGGINTLQVNGNAQTLNGSSFENLTDINVLHLTGEGRGNKVSLTGADTAGITTIVGGTGPSTIDGSDYKRELGSALTWNFGKSSGKDGLIGGQAVGNIFQIANVGNLSNSTIQGYLRDVFGGLEGDTLQILAAAQTIGDAAFAHHSNIDRLTLSTLTSAKGNWLTLGTNAATAGISSVIGGRSADTIDASALSSNIYIDGSIGNGNTLLGGTGRNTLIGSTVTGALNKFILADASYIDTSSIVGGNAGNDTLAFSTGSRIDAGDLRGVSGLNVLQFLGAGNEIILGQDALSAGITTIIGGQGNDTGGSSFNTSAYNTAGVLFEITDQNYLANITTMIGGTGVDTVKFSRDGVSVTDEVVANLYNIDVLQTANGNNRFLISDQFVAAGIDSLIGGRGRDTIDISDNSLYTPTPTSDVSGATSDVIAFDATAGAGYTILGTTNNFPYAKVFGGTAGGSVILDGTSLVDSDFVNMYQANARTLTMRTETGVSVEVGLNAKGSGLTRLNMAGGDDQIDAKAFVGTLAVSGGGGNDLALTSFAALSDLTFTGATGDDTLKIVGSDARAITGLKGDFDALVLNAGNNFVVLGNDAGLSTIYGGSGYDTFSMMSNTTGIHFVVDASKLGALSGFNSLNGGSGSDTLGFSSSPTGGNLVDAQFTRIGLSNLTGGSGGEIENLVTFSDPSTGLGGSTYTLGSISDNAGITKVFFHANDKVDASGRQATRSKAVNFVCTDPTVIGTATIKGTVKNDTLTAKSDVATNFTIVDGDLANVSNLEVFIFENSADTSGVNLELGLNANDSGITTLIGGTGNDTFAASGVGYTLHASIVGGAGNDSIIGGSGKDTLLGSSATFFGADEKDTLTGGGGNDMFILGDATNAYYTSKAGAGDFALITDFAAGDIFQLKNLSADNRTTPPAPANTFGYLFGGDIYTVGNLGAGVNSYLYTDSNKTGIVDAGDNLIAAINSGAVALTTSDLNKSTIFGFI